MDVSACVKEKYMIIGVRVARNYLKNVKFDLPVLIFLHVIDCTNEFMWLNVKTDCEVIWYNGLKYFLYFFNEKN